MTSSKKGELPEDTPEYILNRRHGRETVLGLIYESESKSKVLLDLEKDMSVRLDGYAKELFDALTGELSAIDSLIDETSHKWDLDRMPLVDLAILRIAVLELKQFVSIPSVVIVSEAVELATKYSTESSSPFINGVLAGICGSLRPDDPVT
jgi:N utilization substance protein B